MNEIKLHNNRVLAVRVGVVDRMAEMDEIWDQMRAALLQAPGRVVAAADFRLGAVYSPDISERLLWILKNDNPRIERSAHVVGSSALLGLQIERMVREAGNPARRVFRAVDDALAFVGQVVTATEVSWLRDWYGTLPSTPAA